MIASILKYKRYAVLFIGLSYILAISCSQKKQAEQKPVEKEIVVTVVDGDTFLMSSGKTVRIVGIDTPEAGEKLHDEARDYLAGLILGKEVTIKRLKKGTDRYDRILGEVLVDTLNVGLAMLRKGLAQLYLFKDDDYLKDIYLPVLRNAIDNKLGLWALPPPKAESYYITVKGSYRFHRPLCQSLKNAKTSNLRKIANRLEAIKLGLSPCRNCHP
jgi:micrococcal nuclease